MFGSYRNSGIRRNYTYADILSRYNNTLPIRGRGKTPEKPQIPLGHRRKVDQYWMRRELDGSVSCMCYKTPVVRFKPDGNIELRQEEWTSQTTASFIYEVLGINSYLFNRQLCVSLWDMDGRREYAMQDNEALIVRQEKGVWKYVSGAATTVVHTVNRKAANNVRKQYKEFKRYAINMIKLRGGVFTKDEHVQAFPDHMSVTLSPYSWHNLAFCNGAKAVATYMSDTSEDKHVNFYKALLLIARSYGGSWATMHISESSFVYAFNDVTLGLHRDEVLIKEVLPEGTLKRDTYSKFFRRGWGKYHAEQ